MRFITITLIVHAPDPRTGRPKSTQERFQEVIGRARPGRLVASRARR